MLEQQLISLSYLVSLALTLRLTIYNTKSKENQMTIYMLGGLAINEVEVTEEEGASLIAEGKAFATYDDAYWEARLLDL